MEIHIGRSRAKIQELQSENTRLTQKVKAQELLVDNILAVQELDSTYTGNRYKVYDSAVLEVAQKYQGLSDWGGLQVGNIVDIRAAYIAGQGIKVKKVEQKKPRPKPTIPGKAGASKPQPQQEDTKGDAELAFAEHFFDLNELDHELPQDLAREAEIEGKTLIKLFQIKADPNEPLDAEGKPKEIEIGIRWISWTTNKYKVNTNADDYLQVENVKYTLPNGGSEVTLKPGECVYKRFAGRLDIPNETMPRVAKCLTKIEDLDKALRDWREINSKYAAPIPYFKCADGNQAKAINEQITGLNWKIGKAFASTAEFDYKQPSPEGMAAIEAEIITLMKLISGATGVPIHFLGAPELTTKYGADSSGLLELIAMSTAKEREVWRGAYQELLAKAMRMRNAIEKKTPLNPDLVRVELPQVTKEQWDRIISTWMPLYREGAIQHTTLLEQIPGVNVDEEIKAKEEADASALEELKAENADLKLGGGGDKADQGGFGNKSKKENA
jgi:hypothetical protein